MPLLGLKLFGCTVKNFSTNLGWGSSKSSVRVSLVQDTLLGDLFTPPTIGTPVNISFYALNFSGLLQRHEERKSESANPEYDILIEDPREILEGTEIITGAYNGSTFGVPNLINAYGYWENVGFGGSLVNESGMPWYLIKNAVQTITAGTNGSYGGPLTYKGVTYKLDLSQIPTVPNYYRIQGGTYTNLMRAIEEVCSDSGCDFFVELIITNTTRTIKVRTVSRRLQPAPGVLTNFIQTYTDSGAAKRSSAGLEARNEITSSFLVGGEQTTMFETSTGIHQYFGLDVLGLPLVGNGVDYSMTATLNCSEVFDILGTNEYDTDMLELLNASSDIATWKSYIRSNKPAISALVGLDGMPGVLGNNPPQPQVFNDHILMDVGNLAAHNRAIVSAETDWKANRIFRMVQKNAHLLGKQFLVEIPFVLAKVEPDTTKIVYSHEPTNAGYKETGSPLNLDTVFQDNFSPSADGRYQAFCLFGDLGDIDLRKIDVGSYVVGTEGVYVKCSVDEKIIWLDELTPCVLVHVNEGLDKLPTTGIGNENLLPQAFGGNQAGFAVAAARGAAGAFSLLKSTRPLPANPTDFAIPLKSNILTYGPWYAVGGQGKVHYSQDPGLVPWNYGGTTIMNLTGASRVTDAITWQQYGETGDIEIPGAPIINLGDLLQGNGPTLTNMDIQYGAGGVTTTYRFHTFTNKTAFGNLGKTQFDRIKKLALNNQAIRRDVRQAFNRLLPPSSIANAQISFLQNEIGKELGIPEAPRSPHGIITACSYEDASDINKRRVGCTTASTIEALRSWQATNVTVSGTEISYEEVSSMSMDGFFRPFKTKLKEVGTFDDYTSTYINPIGYGSGNTVLDLDPFQNDNDIDILLVDGGQYSIDAHNYISGSLNEQNQKPLALRAPLILNGWGYSTDDAWVPNENPTTLDGDIETDYLKKSHHWKTGPLETLWDDQRGVWTSFGNCLGVLTSDCGPGSGVEIDLYSSYSDVINGRRKNRTVYNFSSGTLTSGTRVTASFIPEAKSWYVTNTHGNASGGSGGTPNSYGDYGWVQYSDGVGGFLAEDGFEYDDAVNKLTVGDIRVSNQTASENRMVYIEIDGDLTINQLLLSGRVPYINNSNTLSDNAGFTYDNVINKLTIGDAKLINQASSENRIIYINTSGDLLNNGLLTPTRVPYVNASYTLSDNAGFTYDNVINKLTIGDARVTNQASSENRIVYINTSGDLLNNGLLTPTRVPYVNASYTLSDNAGFEYDYSLNKLTVGSLVITNEAASEYRMLYIDTAGNVLHNALLTSTRVVFVDSDGTLVDNAGFEYDYSLNKLTVGSLVITNEAASEYRMLYIDTAGNVLNNALLTPTRVVFVDSDGTLVDDAGFEYDYSLNKLIVGDIKVNNQAASENRMIYIETDGDITVNNLLTSGRVPYVNGTNTLTDSAGFEYESSTTTLTVANTVFSSLSSAGISIPYINSAGKILATAQGAAVADTTDTTDVATQFNLLLSRLRNLNIIAT